MDIYFYAKTGHRVGLDRLRRMAALVKEFEELNPLLMVDDFRAAAYAKSELGIKRSVGIDDIRNIANICKRGDALIFDSDELDSNLHREMIDFFKTFIRVSDDPKDKPKGKEIVISPYLEGENIINAILVDKRYFGEFKKDIDRVFFYKDDDYNKNLLKISKVFKGLDTELLEGFYFFLGYIDQLKENFSNIYESEEYQDVIKKSKIFLTCSFQSALESAATGTKVIFIKERENSLIPLFEDLGIKVIDKFDKNIIKDAIETDFNINYEPIYEKNVTIVKTFIKNNLNL